MVVHGSSVISTWLNTYRPDVYDALTSQENNTYINLPGTPTPTIGNWIAEFQKIDDSLTAWKDINREDRICEFLPVMYALFTMNTQFKIGSAGNLNLSEALTIFDVDGLFVSILARAVTFYNDWNGTTSALIDIDKVVADAAGAAELVELLSIRDVYIPLIQCQATKLLYEDIVPLDTATKLEMAVETFTTRDWKKIYDNLGVGGLVLPPLS